jgi:hypothetical protein
VWCRNDAEGAGLLLGVARRRDAGDSSWRARDLRTVEDVVVEALRAATVDKSCKTLSMMLLGAGGKRTWPRVYSLVQMLRGLRTFYVTHPEARRLQLRIHDTPETSAQAAHHWDASIWTAIASRRLDHEEILNCGALRCYVEQAGSDSNRRVPMYLTDDKTVSQVAMFFKIDVKSRRWRVDIVPRPGPDYEPFELARHGDQTLKQFAIVPGSTIRFIRD